MRNIFFFTGLFIILVNHFTYPVELKYKYDERIFLIYNTKSKFINYYNGEFYNEVDTLQVSSIETLKVNNQCAKMLLTSYFMENTDNFDRKFEKSSSKEYYKIKKDQYGKYYGFRNNYGIYDFPVFPACNLEYGETWSNEAEFYLLIFDEGLVDIRLSSDVHYQFLGIEKKLIDKAEKDVAVILAYAVIVYDLPQKMFYLSGIKKMSGLLKFTINFDVKKGRIISIDETSDYTTMLYDNSIIDTYSQSSTNYQVSRVFSKIEVEEIKEVVKEIEVKLKEDKSISITLGKLQFEPDKANLLEGELKRLDDIAFILAEKYKFNKIVIIGHTARAGDELEQKQLSEKRARRIAEYFIDKHGFDKELITYKGMGAESPIADNLTEEGRSKNRRVEIIVLSELE